MELILFDILDPRALRGNQRRFVNGVCWILRSGARWCDLPPRYGRWKVVHQRFLRWARKGVWERMFAMLTADHDNEYLMIDSTIVRAHQQAATAKKKGQTRLWGVPEEV
jgi:putative transposase